MRLYHIVSGILFILPIVEFAVAAPIQVREKLQAGVDMVHIPTIAMLAKRVNGLDEIFLELFGFLPKLEESSSSRLSEPADGWTDLRKPLSPIPEEPPPEPSPSSSATITDPLMESSSPSTTPSIESFLDDGWWDDDEHGQMYTGYDSDLDHSLTGADPPRPNMTPRPSNDPDFDRNYGINMEDLPLFRGSESADHSLTGADPPQSNTNPRPSNHPDFDQNSWMNSEDLPPPKRPKLSSSKEFGQAQEYQTENVQQPNPGPSNPKLPAEPGYDVATLPPSDLGSPKELDEAAQGSSPELTDPGLQSDQQSLSTDFQPVDPQDALYAAKGKAKEFRRVPGTARDVGNAVKRELQPAERSLDPGE